MKSLFYLLATLAFQPAFAALPPELCKAANPKCSPQMTAIERAFSNGVPIDQALLNTTVFSGACYHLAKRYDPTHTHWGVAFLAEKKSDIYYAGRFGFFQKSNPYKEILAKDAPVYFPNQFEPKRKGKSLSSGPLFVDMNPGGINPVRYWVLQKHDAGELLVRAQWGQQHWAYCQYQPNLEDVN